MIVNVRLTGEEFHLWHNGPKGYRDQLLRRLYEKNERNQLVIRAPYGMVIARHPMEVTQASAPAMPAEAEEERFDPAVLALPRAAMPTAPDLPTPASKPQLPEAQPEGSTGDTSFEVKEKTGPPTGPMLRRLSDGQVVREATPLELLMFEEARKRSGGMPPYIEISGGNYYVE